MELQESVGPESSNLLRLPRELRIPILRELLFCTPFISNESHLARLHVQILRVNKQLYMEGLEILYGENYYRIEIFKRNADERACFIAGTHFAQQVHYRLLPFKLIQHYDILVEIQEAQHRWAVKSALRRVVNVLSRSPRIKHLRIALGGHEHYCSFETLGEEICGCARVLQPLTRLRGVHRVDLIGGIRPHYIAYLKRTMEGKSLLDHLPRMYKSLEHLAGPFDECQDGLKMACKAMENNDVQEFKRLRSDLTRQVAERTYYALNHLTDHDAEPHEEGEWAIERRKPSRRCKA